MSFVYSLSQEFYCDPARFQRISGDGRFFNVYSGLRSGHPVAEINHETGVVTGITGNSGADRLERLSDIEKADVGTLVAAMVSAGHVKRIPTNREQYGKAQATACSTCGSNQPHLHPAIQFEGEVEICTDEFHLQETEQNTPEIVELVVAKLAREYSDDGVEWYGER